MADKQVAVKSMIAAMNALSNIQQQKTKLLTTMLQGSEKFRNNFMLQIAKNQMEKKQKEEMIPLETQGAVDKERAIRELPPSPAQEAQIKANEARTEYYRGGRPGPKITDSEKFRTFYGDITSAIESGSMTPEEGWSKISRSYPDKLKDLMMGGVSLNTLKKITPKSAPSKPKMGGIAEAAESIGEGTVIRNKQTGERKQYKGGAWVTI